MELRKYQKETVDLILSNIQKGVKSQLINSPTGSGKTFISASVIQELNKQGKRVFFLVANEPLIMQTYDEFGKFNLSRSIIKSGKDKYYNPNALNQIVMIQTYISRMDKIKAKPDILYFDEADFYSKGKSVQKIKEHFPNIQIVGVTASPTDTRGYLLDNFDFYHEVVTVRQLQKEGYLSIDKNFIPLSPDLSNVRIMNTGEFNEDDLDNACNKSYIIDDIVRTYKAVNCGYKGIIFAINIDHAEKLTKAFNEAGIKTAVIHSKMKKFLRDYWLECLKNGKIQLLCNVGILTRGFNQTDLIDCIYCRPTASLPLWIQSVGRMARIHEGKQFFRLFDYANNIERHGLWSEPRIYSKDTEPKREVNHSVIVCPRCFSVIYERHNNHCPYCNELIQIQQEKRERQIIETQRAEKVIEIQSEYNAGGIISRLTDLLGHNGNTFYYTKLLPLRPMSVDIEAFNSEVSRLISYCKRKGYKPYYVLYKLRDKMEGVSNAN